MRRLFWVVGVLVLLLGMSALLLRTAASDALTRPSVENRGPSGASLLADLLENQGYRVHPSGDRHISVAKGQAVLLFVPGGETPVLGAEGDQVTDLVRSVRRMLAQGATVVVLPFAPDFESIVRTASEQDVGGTGETVELTDSGRYSYFETIVPIPPEAVRAEIWKSPNGEGFVTASRNGGGTVVAYRDGIGLVNRYLDRGRNASAMISLLHAVGAEKDVVFWEAAFAPSDLGLLATIGPWAQGAWFQIVLLALAIAYTWGRRFGLPSEAPFTQQGTRTLVDSVAESARRMRSLPFVVSAIVSLWEADLSRGRRRDDAEAIRAKLGDLLRMDPQTRPSDALSRLREVQTALSKSERRRYKKKP